MTEPKVRLPAGERRSLILAEGAALFGERGYDGVTIEQIADAAGITKPIVYRHFSSKKDLYLALLARHRDDLPTFIAGSVGGGAEEVRAILEAWLRYAEENAHGWQMLFQDGGGDAEVAGFRRSVQDRAREVMADFLRINASEPIATDEMVIRAEIARGGLAALIVWWSDHPEVPRQSLLNAAIGVLRLA